MQIKTFRAKNLQRALARVRDELGPDAAVLATRDIGGGLTSWWTGNRVEVTASTSVQVHTRLPGVELAEPAEATSHEESPRRIEKARRQTDQLESMAQLIPRMVTPVAENPLSRVHQDIYNELLSAGMDTVWARHLLQIAQESLTEEQWLDPIMVRGKLTYWVQSQLSIAPPIQLGQHRSRPFVVALVGPTGVGKTTTLAKLAAGFTLEEKLKVGLITIDTFRIGAVEQLSKYAEIMNLPMAVVESENEMQSAIQKMSDCRLIFIDTAGRTPRDASQLELLQGMLLAAQPDETHLVMSATTSANSFIDAMHRYSVVAPNRLVLSKLDEVRGLGELFPALRQKTLPIAYVTTGQNVPRDIESAKQTRLAAFMLGHCRDL